MICLLFALLLSLIGAVFLGFFFLAFAMLPATISFFCTYLPLAKLATIETFLEIGLFIYLILTKIFRRNTFIKILGILVTVFLTGAAIYMSFNRNGGLAILTFNKPLSVLAKVYFHVRHFFLDIIHNLTGFFNG